MKPRPTSNSTALVPFKVAFIAGNIAYCAGTICMSLSDQAAGFVVRRFTITNASPNMTNVKRTSVASEAESGKTSGLAGYSSIRKASTPYASDWK